MPKYDRLFKMIDPMFQPPPEEKTRLLIFEIGRNTQTNLTLQLWKIACDETLIQKLFARSCCCYRFFSKAASGDFFTSLSDLIALPTHPLEKRVSISVDESHSSRFCKHFGLIGPWFNEVRFIWAMQIFHRCIRGKKGHLVLLRRNDVEVSIPFVEGPSQLEVITYSSYQPLISRSVSKSIC